MFAPRTVKTLIALFAAMTSGAILLMLLDTDPIQAPGTHLVAVAAADEAELAVVTQTDIPLKRWRGIVVHSLAEGPTMLARCHFVVAPSGDGGVEVTSNRYWLRQQAAPHVLAQDDDWGSCIGIGLKGDYSSQSPTNAEMQALVKLVRDLQIRFRIPASRVYLYGEISSTVLSPGAAFPAAVFQDSLLNIR